MKYYGDNNSSKNVKLLEKFLMLNFLLCQLKLGSTNCAIETSSETNDNPENNPTPCETSDLILNLEKKLLSRFDGLDKEILNLEDIVIKELQLENQCLRKKVSDLQKKIYSAEENINLLEQYIRQNNIEITGIPESVENEKLEETVIEVLNKIDINVSNNDIEACHCLGKQKNKPRKTIIRFVNSKFAKKALLNRKGLKHADMSSLGLDSHEVFINENLTRANSKIAFHSRRLKRNSLIDKCYTKDGVVHIVCPDLQNRKVIKVFHLNTLMDLFPNFDFGDDGRVEDHNDSIQSSY